MVECSRCHNRFNYEWSLSGSLGPIRFGLDRSMFRCPFCRELNSFDVTYRGRDPALPTYNDMQVGVGGRLLGQMFGPLFGLVAAGVVLLAASPYRLEGMVAILGGFGWLAGFAYRLDRRLRTPESMRPANIDSRPGARSTGAGVYLGLGFVEMQVGGGLGAMDFYSYCPPGENCGTGNPSLNLAIALAFFFVGLALVAAGLLHRSSRPTQALGPG